MAATVSAWKKPGAWALDSEENEQELIQQNGSAANGASPAAAALSDFPSLTAAATTKTKKKKGQTLSLGEFYSAPSKTTTYQAAKGLTTEDLMNLPTGPRQRTAEELEKTRLGGGFRSYGMGDRNNESSNSRWGNSRDSNDEGRRGGGFGRESNREVAPSRADEIDDWGAAKKSSVGSGAGGFERRERGERGGFFADSHSRADESDSWVTNKSFVSSEERKFSKFDGPRERRVGFESTGGADSENWAKKKEEEGKRFGGSGSAFDSLRERRGGSEMNGNGDLDSWGKRREEGSGGVRPKLNLQPRKLPVGESDTVEVKASKGSNPFGDARPREQVLKEKGQDWKEIDEKLESMKMKDAVDGTSFGRRNFGSFNGRDDSERNWRKNGSRDVTPPSSANSENGVVDEPETRDPQDQQI